MIHIIYHKKTNTENKCIDNLNNFQVNPCNPDRISDKTSNRDDLNLSVHSENTEKNKNLKRRNQEY